MSSSRITKKQLDLVRLAASGSNGDKVRIICPVCRGGRTGEISMVVNPGAQFARCYRNSCGVAISLSGIVSPPTGDPRPSRSDAHTEPLTDAKQLPSYPSITLELANEFGVRRMTKGGFLIPIRSFTGQDVGDVEYSPSASSTSFFKKARGDIMGGSWFRRPLNPYSLVIVEDQWSAMALASVGQESVALLGTYLSPTLLMRIAQNTYNRIAIALDKDALSTASKIQRRLRPYANTVMIYQLGRDLKHLSPEELAFYQ